MVRGTADGRASTGNQREGVHVLAILALGVLNAALPRVVACAGEWLPVRAVAEEVAISPMGGDVINDVCARSASDALMLRADAPPVRAQEGLARSAPPRVVEVLVRAIGLRLPATMGRAVAATGDESATASTSAGPEHAAFMPSACVQR